MISIQDRKSQLKFPDFHESGCEEAKGRRVKIDIHDLYLFFQKSNIIFNLFIYFRNHTHTHTISTGKKNKKIKERKV